MVSLTIKNSVSGRVYKSKSKRQAVQALVDSVNMKQLGIVNDAATMMFHTQICGNDTMDSVHPFDIKLFQISDRFD